MDQATRLKYASAFVGVFWTIGMVWRSGSPDPVNVVVLAVCGAALAYLWHRFMGRYLRWAEKRQGRGPR
ncbi:MAG: hypothetical protein AB7K35_14585 [Pseudorhodoplanes sp.]